MGTRYSIQKLSSCPHIFTASSPNSLCHRISGKSRPTEGGHVDDALFFPVHTQYGIDLVIVKRGDLAGPQTQRYSRERHILGDVSGIEIDIAIRPLLILPLRTGKDSCPSEYDRRL